MKFCSQCAAPIARRVPPGDNRERHVCDACGTVHYENPRIVAGCVPEWEGKVLLCRRAIEPRYGKWTLPAGFMENGETTLEAAARETLEEACARVEVLGLYAIFNLPHINQVYVMFRGRLLDLDYAVGAESLEVGLFERDAIPWSELAFATVHHTLKFWIDDFTSGNFPMRMGDIVPRDGRAEILMHVAKT